MMSPGEQFHALGGHLRWWLDAIKVQRGELVVAGVEGARGQRLAALCGAVNREQELLEIAHAGQMRLALGAAVEERGRTRASLPCITGEG